MIYRLFLRIRCKMRTAKVIGEDAKLKIIIYLRDIRIKMAFAN